MAILSPSPKLQFFDANGNPLVGGKLYSYTAGTTSPLATYTDSTNTSVNTNPMILDSRGEASVWLGASAYKLVLYSATDVLIWSVDNVTAASSDTVANLAASTGSSLIGYIQGGTGSVATTVQTKLRESVSVKDFGAVGDGVTDDTAAVQAALNSASEYGILDLVGGSYLVSGVSVAVNNVTVRNGRLVARSNASIAVIKAAAGTSGIQFQNLRVYINRTIITASDCAGIFFDQCTNGKAINCHVDGSKNDNYGPQLYGCIYGYLASKIDVVSCTAVNAHKEGIMFAESDDIYIYDCEGRSAGFSNIGTSGGNRAIITGCRAFNSGATNITMNSQDSIVSNCLASGNVLNNGILIGHISPTSQNANNCLIANNRVLSSGGKGVATAYCTNVSIEGNTVTGCTEEGIYIIPNPSVNGGVSVTGNVIDTCTVGVYAYGSAENQIAISGNTIRTTSGNAVLVASNGQVNVANNVFRNVAAGVLALGHVTGATLTGAGITNLSINNNIFRGVTLGAITVRHLLQASIVGNIFESVNASNTASVDLFTLENSNGGTASNMPTSVVFQSNTTKATSASSKLLDAQANIRDAVITRFNFQNNDLQDFAPANIFVGAGFGTTATFSAVGNQVGTNDRSLQITIASGTTSTVVSNTNLLGRSTGPVFAANDATFGTLNVRVTNYAYGSVTLTHTAPGANSLATMSII